jgi:signal transduction histidine kinase
MLLIVVPRRPEIVVRRQALPRPAATAARAPAYRDRSRPVLQRLLDAPGAYRPYSAIMRADHRADLPYAVGAAVIAMLLAGNAVAAVDAGPLRPADLGLIALTAVALAACRRYPVPALAITTAAMLAFHLRVHAGVSAAFAVLGTVYVAARSGHRIAAALASVVFLTGFLGRDLVLAEGRPAQLVAERTTLLLGWFVAANVAGLVTRQRRAYLDQVEQRAIEAERTREEAALRRAGEERLRIARELHDSLTHSISIIKVQAGVAVHLARKRGEEPPPALLAIQDASSEAMRELRATLDVLRSPADEPPGSHLGRVGDLVERTRAAGVPVTLTVTGPGRPLPAEIDQAGYRVVQEALTNVARHAGPATAQILVEYAPERLVIEVTDDGAADPDHPAEPGVGLSGMRERVTGLGGRLHAAPRPGGGFAVRAELPLAQAPLTDRPEVS